MLAQDAPSLLNEIRSAEKQRGRHIRIIHTLLRRFVGNYYADDLRGKPVPENMIYTFVANVLPEVIFDNPEVTVTAQRLVTHKPVAEWMRYAINGWIKEVRVRDELEQAAMDMLFGYGILKVGLETRGDFAADDYCGVMGKFTMEALKPYLVRVDPDAFFMDAQGKSWAQARFMGERYTRDYDDLMNDERFDREQVAKLSPNADSDNGRSVGDGTGSKWLWRPRNGDQPDRRRIVLYDIYLRETQQIATLAENAESGVFVREPTDFHGPREGPYVPLGVYGVPNSPYPLSPIAALAEQFMELNAHASAAAVEASSHKKIVIVDANNPELKQAVQQTVSGGVAAVPGVSAAGVVNVELGGTSQFRLSYVELLRQRADRMSFMSDANRGKASGVTATEAGIANEASNTAKEFIHLKFRDAVKQALARVGWYFFYEPAVVQPVSWTDEDTGQPSEGLFLGGQQEGQEDLDWLTFFLDIEPFSMRRMDPTVQAQRAQVTSQVATEMAMMIPQAPWINWRAVIDDIGEANNIPDFASRILSPLGMQMLQQMIVPGMANGANPMAPPGPTPPGANPLAQGAGMGAPVNNFPYPQAQQQQPRGAPAGPAQRPAMAG